MLNELALRDLDDLHSVDYFFVSIAFLVLLADEHHCYDRWTFDRGYWEGQEPMVSYSAGGKGFQKPVQGYRRATWMTLVAGVKVIDKLTGP
jgi:hypothetical protein